MSKPLVLTLRLEKSTTDFLTNLRATYFPKHRNHLNAHITLFHAIPPSRHKDLDRAVRKICANQRQFGISVSRPSKMGKRGVMVHVSEDQPRTIEGFHRGIVEVLAPKEPERVRQVPGSSAHYEHQRQTKEDGEMEKERLTEQDLAPLRSAHVTILNKAMGEDEVEKCYAELQEVFGCIEGRRKDGTALGFQLWEYNDGPWIHLQDYSFAT